MGWDGVGGPITGQGYLGGRVFGLCFVSLHWGGIHWVRRRVDSCYKVALLKGSGWLD